MRIDIQCHVCDNYQHSLNLNDLIMLIGKKIAAAAVKIFNYITNSIANKNGENKTNEYEQQVY